MAIKVKSKKPIDLDAPEAGATEEAPETTAAEAPEAAAPEEAPIVVKPAPKNIVSLKSKEADDLVTISMLEEIVPPPVIGHYDFKMRLGVQSLAKGASYRIPRSIAGHLKDAGKVIITD